MNKASKFLVFLFVLILVLLVLNFVFDKSRNNVSNEDTQLSPDRVEADRIPVSSDPEIGITVSPGISLYKSPIIFEGYKYCSFVFEANEKPYVKDHEYVYEKFCNLSSYPLIGEFLYSEYNVDLIDQPEWEIAAQYIGKGEIKINRKYKDASNLDLYVAHEIAHSSTETLNLPGWLSEGIAVYSSYRFFDTESKLTPYYFEGFLTWDPNNSSYSDNVKGYAHCGYVMKKFVDKYGDNAFVNLILELDNKISPNDSIEAKNQKIQDAMKLVSQDNNFVLEDFVKAE